MELYKGFIGPEFPTLVEIVENGVKYQVDVKDGQKTGFFLDQKYNRLAIQKLCKDARVLDCFTHTGSFALNAGIAGAKEVTGESQSTVSQDTKTLTRLKDIITYVERHYMEPLSLSDISDRFALNPEYFCRFFKKNMGFTFLEYVNMVRLSHIYSDLMQTGDSITQIMERHGFINYKVFNRMFKEVYGCLPSKVRHQ